MRRSKPLAAGGGRAADRAGDRQRPSPRAPREFVVVTGYEGERLGGLPRRPGYAPRHADRHCVRNADCTAATAFRCWPRRAAGGRRFMLLMSDHLFDPSILSDCRRPALRRGRGDPGGRSPARQSAGEPGRRDPGRAGRGRPRSATSARGWKPTTAIDTGIFLATRALLKAIRANVAGGGGGGISDGMQRPRRQGPGGRLRHRRAVLARCRRHVAYEQAEREAQGAAG